MPAQTPGVVGLRDRADPNVVACFGDTPGPLGINDYAQPLMRQSNLLSTRIQPAALGSLPIQSVTQPLAQNQFIMPATVTAGLLPLPNPAARSLNEADYKSAA